MAREKWEGGYVRKDDKGRSVYIIEREVDGRRFHVSTRATTIRAALVQLQRFEADPAGYRPLGAPIKAPVTEGEPLYLTAGLALAFIEHSATKGNAPEWIRTQRFYLRHWIEDIGAVNLRKATLGAHIVPALDKRKTGRAGRIIVLKALFGWLRKERHIITSAEDCTLDLPVPQARPEKWKRRKAVPFEHVKKAAEHLATEYRDMLTLLAATGWHTTELERFIRDPESELLETDKGSTIAVLVTRHKGGEPTRTPLTDPHALLAAKRLRKRGKVPRKANEALRKACKAAKVKPFTLGVMRHSVATWAVERGAEVSRVAEFLQHKDARTTRRFYADVAVPTHAVSLPSLAPSH